MTDLRHVRAIWALNNGRQGFTNLYFTLVNDEAQDTYSAVRAYFNSIRTFFAVGVSVTVDTVQTIISDTDGQPIGTEVATSAGPVTGTASGDNMPGQVQGLMRLRTGKYVNGREIRGRIFIPCATEGVAAGKPSSDYVTTVNTAGAALVTATSSSGPLRVYSRQHGTSAVVAATQCAPTFKTLRRRQFYS